MSPVTADRYDILEERKMEAPPRGFVPQHLEVETGSSMSMFQHVSAASVEIRVPLFGVNDGATQLRARRPIVVRLYQEGEWQVAENESLNVIAHGESLGDAMADFQKVVVHLFSHYSQSREADLTAEALRLKHLYADTFAGIPR